MGSDASWQKWLDEVAEKAKKMKDEELLEAYAKSAARVGYENSGLVIVTCPTGDRDYIKIYKAELLERLKAVKAPTVAAT